MEVFHNWGAGKGKKQGRKRTTLPESCSLDDLDGLAVWGGQGDVSWFAENYA